MICKACQKEFTISDADRQYYNKIGVIEPQRCPDCRFQLLTSFRNERVLYKNKCAKTGKDIITSYSPDSGFTVYNYKEWWGDDWDPLKYGQEFDFSRTLSEQFYELQKVVPLYAVHGINSVNSDYSSFARDAKNCYLCFSAVNDEDCYYSSNIDFSHDCCDCMSTKKQCELCYQGIDIEHCYNCSFIQDCGDLENCHHCYNCRGCHDCFSSANLRNSSYCWFNEQLSAEEYRKKFEEANLGSYFGQEKWRQLFSQHLRKFPRKYATIIKSNNCVGDYLSNSKNLLNCFDTYDSEDCARVYRGLGVKDCVDIQGSSGGELVYYSVCTGQGQSCQFCSQCHFNLNVAYSTQCFNSQDLFACVSLRRKKFCILNKQYTEEEYKKLLPKIIEHLKTTGEWGEYFPPQVSPFGYNETLAMDFFPLTREEALKQGFNWQDKLPFTVGQETLKTTDIPDHIKDIKDDIIKQVLVCVECGKNYKIISQELDFYRRQNLPSPRKCFNCRFIDRFHLRNPYKLWGRKCDKCGTDIKTTYAPDRAEKIYCETCYQKEIY